MLLILSCKDGNRSIFIISFHGLGRSTCSGIDALRVYALEEGREEETRCFYKRLQKEVEKYSKSDSLIISGDLNARVGNQPIPNPFSETFFIFNCPTVDRVQKRCEPCECWRFCVFQIPIKMMCDVLSCHISYQYLNQILFC